MKHLIYFLLFSTAVFSQNYQYAIGKNKRLAAVPAPTGLVASQITQTSVDLAWTAPASSTSISNYGIYNYNSLLVKSVGTGTTYKVTGLTPETAYSLTVRSIDKTGNISGDSNIQTFTTAKVVVVVAAPTGLVASQITDNSVNLSWTASASGTSVSDYGIYNNNTLLVKSVGTGTTYKVTGLTPETAYSLTVRTIDKSGNISADSNVQTFTTAKAPVPAPTGLVASQITENSVDLTWTAPASSTTVSDYGIYNNNTLLVKSVGTGTTYKVTGLTPETAYSLTVRTIDKTGNISADSNVQTFTTAKAPAVPAGVNNQQEEIAYFNAYLLPVSEKANIQKALDTYGSVRLEKGDYSGVNIVMRTGQKLYGSPSFLSRVSNITIASGSTGVVLEDLCPIDKTITLQAGGVISGCTFKSIKWATLSGTNVMFENNTLINFAGNIMLDCSTSGYFRNNKIIRHQSGSSNLLIMKGNSGTPSYGNVNLWSNYLTPHGDTTQLNNLQSQTFVGLDAESWNYTNEGTKAMFYAQNMGNVKITDFNGGNNSAYKTPAFDIDAADVFLFNRVLADPADILSVRANTFLVKGSENYIRKAGTVTGFDLQGNLDNNNAIKYNGVLQTATISNQTDVAKISNTILGTRGTPWNRPTWETLPDPLGPNWKTDRAGKPDSTAYIQDLINTNGIANLPEGVFYISSTLTIPSDGAHGIIGKGTGKTVICGLTDNFNLISIKGSADGSIVLSYLTLQGGADGFYASTDFGGLNMAYQNLKFVVFRNQTNAIHIKRTGGFDNCFFDNVSFVDCNKGFYQEPTPGTSAEGNSAYIDKTMFYKNQFINCTTAISMLATRADNLNAWVDCKFNGGNTAFDLAGQNAPIIANCDITNYRGTNVIRSNVISLYNTNVYGNSVSGSTINSIYTGIEGCSFSDSSPMFSPVVYNRIQTCILNSTITGNVVAVIPPNQGFYPQSAVFSNSTLLSNSTISKLLVSIKDGGTPTILITTTPNPYPQFLMTQ